MKLKIILLILIGFVLTARFVFIPAPSVSDSKPTVNCIDNTKIYDGPSFPYCQSLEKINQEYVSKVKPIFQKKCLMCHGVVKKVPLYTVIPPVSFLINHHRKEAKEHLDMRLDYPFLGHDEDLLEDLDELKEVIEEGEMPPPLYKLMHWSSGITKKEKEIIFNWINQAIQILQSDGLTPKEHPHDHQHDHEHNHDG